MTDDAHFEHMWLDMKTTFAGLELIAFLPFYTMENSLLYKGLIVFWNPISKRFLNILPHTQPTKFSKELIVQE